MSKIRPQGLSPSLATATYAALDGDGDLAINAVKVAASALPYGSPLLARASYNPAGVTTLSTVSTTSVDADATNLTVTFTAPDDGIVDVTLEACADVAAGGGGVQNIWSLRSGGSDVAGTVRTVTRNIDAARVTTIVRVSGLTAGASYTYTWGIRTSNATYAARILAGSTYGPAEMRVGKG